MLQFMGHKESDTTECLNWTEPKTELRNELLSDISIKTVFICVSYSDQLAIV